jgi:hypothetical protein
VLHMFFFVWSNCASDVTLNTICFIASVLVFSNKIIFNT